MSQLAVQLDERVRRWVWLLGIAGLIPFVAHTLVVALMAPPFNIVAVSSQIQYAGLILTFIGGLHWGVLLVAGQRFNHREIALRLIWSVVPSLYAFWFVQITHPKPLLYLAAGLVVALLIDWRFYTTSVVPSLRGFLPIRVLLTVVASTCLLLTWYFA